MQEKLEALQQKVVEINAELGFIHHCWYTQWHLQIVVKIASELAQHYPEADKSVVEAAAWLHDIGKALGDNGGNAKEARRILEENSFSQAFIEEVVYVIERMDMHSDIDISKETIEVQIVSSADGCSHLVGPFMPIFVYEFHDRPFFDLMRGNANKARLDWHRKITLPEAQKAFRKYYEVTLVQAGELPKKYIDL